VENGGADPIMPTTFAALVLTPTYGFNNNLPTSKALDQDEDNNIELLVRPTSAAP